MVSERGMRATRPEDAAVNGGRIVFILCQRLVSTACLQDGYIDAKAARIINTITDEMRSLLDPRLTLLSSTTQYRTGLEADQENVGMRFE